MGGEKKEKKGPPLWETVGKKGRSGGGRKGVPSGQIQAARKVCMQVVKESGRERAWAVGKGGGLLLE